jgi:hypothetical protein
LLKMAKNVTSRNTALSSWDTRTYCHQSGEQQGSLYCQSVHASWTIHTAQEPWTWTFNIMKYKNRKNLLKYKKTHNAYPRF